MPKFLETLPEELRANPALQVFKDAEDATDVAKAFIETKALVGRKGILLPPEGTKDDAPEMQEFYNQLGRPKEAKEYELPALQLPKGMTLQQEEIEEFKAQAHRLGMSKKQFKEVFGYRINKLVKESEAAQAAMTQKRQSTETELRSKWGAKYDERTMGIQKLLDTYNTEKVDVKDLDPGTISFLGNVLEDLSEATLGKIGHAKGGELTPSEAKEEIHAMRTSKEHPMNAAYNDPSMGSKHLEAKKRMDLLYKWANPGKKDI